MFTPLFAKHRGLIHLKLVKTVLKMRLLTEKEIMAYIASGEWVGCAGGYSIQGRAKCFFPFLSGCYSNVGLPLPSLIGVLKLWGFLKVNEAELIIEKYGSGNAVAVLHRKKIVDLFIDPPTDSVFIPPTLLLKQNTKENIQKRRLLCKVTKWTPGFS